MFFNENLKKKKGSSLLKRPEALVVKGKLCSGNQIKSKGFGKSI